MVAGKEVTRQAPAVSREQLALIETPEDAARLFAASGAAFVGSEELGDGFERCDKSELINVPMIVFDVKIVDGDMGRYVTCRAVTASPVKRENSPGIKVVFADGSTGLRDELIDFMESHGGAWPTHWRHGLRVSSYTYFDEKDQRDKPAQTYYLNTSA